MRRLRDDATPRRWAVGLLAATTLAVVACQEETPTGIGGSLAASPVTVELELPWSVFASNLEVFGGYGVPSELGVGIVAEDFAGTLDAHTLVRIGLYPDRATVRDTTGTARTDSLLTFEGGRFVAFMDTIASTATGPVTLRLGALQDEWQARTATWTAAIDTINDLRPWPEAGAGPVVEIGTAVWDPSAGDSVLFQLDTAQLAAWSDTTDLSRGARIELVTPGERLRVRTAAVRIDARASIADTVVTLSATTREITFVYDPIPAPPPDGIRIGGAPSWRTVLDLGVPATLNAPQSFCDVVACPHTLQSGQVSYAALVLTSRASEPAFQPTDSIGLDVRPVLKRSAMPKSPLGRSLIGTILGRRVAPAAFGAAPGVRVEVPITALVRALIDGDDGSGHPPPNALALLSAIEPLSIAFASFEGPGSADEPRLRLVLTIGSAVELP